ncbi:uncharacterized protein B0J16DRAFT_347994 [Fusarium flagelliforme]|uniref:Uncharacterized protein n=1 Tax=Fusarium flagelliforme TaxID=2675880 RepID=A0A395MVT5_9HYPO|nr:uncharacterized protein B0J16DRAFT_347994 [Fusarium flagelliforme]KAH7179974.1 hypothetical protein B0J16DRAFT_347994 [Fusarium flagelliforme]RFN51867.1 hypothetical protein FIE12Z_3828 [Fusarium flagelliforme]
MSQEDEQAPIQIVSARFRTATSPLRRLPLVMSRPDGLQSRLGDKIALAIHDRAEEVLKAFKLVDSSDDEDYYENYYDVDISMRKTKNCPETAAPTIMIYFKVFPTDREALYKATKQIAEFARDSSDEPFCVEMIGQPLVWTIAYGPVRDRPDLLQCWDKMRVLVYERLEAHEATKGSMTSISLFRYGTKRFYGNNPVTIFITVDFDSQEVGWPDVINDIEKSLKEHQLPDLYIHIEHNVGFSSAPPSLLDLEGEYARNRLGRGSIEDDYNKTVNLGEVIGPANFVMREDWTEGYVGHGNLGCYVEVKTAQGSWEKYGLTNYHIVRGAFPGFNTTIVNKETVLVPPSAESSLFIVDEKGLPPGSHEALAMMESPPRSMHDYTLWIAQINLDDMNRSLQRLHINAMGFLDAEETYARVDGYKVELIQEVEKKKDFFYFYQHAMGEIFAASGFNERTTENGRLDWALIKVAESRTGTNILPDRSAWARPVGRTRDAPFLTFGRQLKPPGDQPGPSESISLENQVQCEEAFKYGTTTGPIRGKLHIFKTNVQFKDDQHVGDDPLSSEYLFQMKREVRDEPFAGSIVYDEWGCILGLLSRGLQPQRAEDFHVYVTPIEHVFRHIKESSNGRIVDVRVAQDQSA